MTLGSRFWKYTERLVTDTNNRVTKNSENNSNIVNTAEQNSNNFEDNFAGKKIGDINTRGKVKSNWHNLKD